MPRLHEGKVSGDEYQTTPFDSGRHQLPHPAILESKR